MDLQDEIARAAYELFEKSGWAHGRDVENWLAAERIVRQRYAEQAKKEAKKTALPRAKKPEARR
ncbi:MAG: DUF2934 domain-containing protein [Deltaproteobacteria bacterium]|nr:DUF2934 domain-containing protein [Deltaproteobacteria bacterium]